VTIPWAISTVKSVIDVAGRDRPVTLMVIPVKKFPTRTITLDDRPINLTQVLKLGGCAQSGGEAKVLIAGGQVRVNGQVELRKRCQMKAGDTIAIEGGPTIVLLAGTIPDVLTPEA
jgi:ribosome-associated protein